MPEPLTNIRWCLALLICAACGSAPEQGPPAPGEPTTPSESPRAPSTEPAPPAAPGEPTETEPGAAIGPNAAVEQAPEKPATSAATEPSAAVEPTPAKPATAASTRPVTKPSAPRGPQPQDKAAPAPPEPAPSATPEPAKVAEPCGEKGQPRCPLQAWMEDNLQKAMDDEDLAALARSLTRVQSFVPDPSWNAGATGWSTIVKAAQDATRASDLASVKQGCKTCHKAWRKKYKATFRTRPLP